MKRIFAGIAAALFIALAAIFVWKSQADAGPAPAVAQATAPRESEPMTALDVDGPPQASDATREQKRFGRFDRNRDGAVGAEEYLQSRRKAYTKLDVNGDGRLSFEEYAAKTIDKFNAADRDQSGRLNATEFLATRVARSKPKSTNCPSPLRAVRETGGDEG